ncbi:MAG: hypothetical protein HQM08_10040 [Candidatus Riflebacteria bacterium]|nr:hypothetical protein [Candidatus Riflebacteria bacterium]
MKSVMLLMVGFLFQQTLLFAVDTKVTAPWSGNSGIKPFCAITIPGNAGKQALPGKGSVGSVRYFMPKSIQLEINSKSQANDLAIPTLTEPQTLTATVKTLVGNLTQMKIYFESSDDLEVTPSTANLETLSSGTFLNYDLTVKSTSTPKNAGGSWVRLRVSYLPDFEALKAAVSSDLVTYSNEVQRKQLLKSIEGCKAKQQMDIQAIRFFYPDKK